MSNIKKTELYQKIRDFIHESRNSVVRHINTTMVYTYFEIGRIIVEDEQQGKERAEYGKETLKHLSVLLTKEFGKGFTVRNLELMRQFFTVFSKSKSVISKSPAQMFQLSWTHYIKLMRIDDAQEREFYEIEAINNNWSVRELERQFDSSLFERVALSKNRKEIKNLSKKGQLINNPRDIIKDPYVLEFLGLKEKSVFSETELEQAIIDKLELFLLELGKGFTFVARQKRISFDGTHFYIDLVFYNRLLKSFFLIDLKIGTLKHQDIGQMQMYVNFYDREIKLEDENPTIGLILCKDKSDLLVQYTLPENNDQIYASKYKLYLPTKEELIQELRDL